MSDDKLIVVLEDVQDKLTTMAEAISVLASDMHEVKQQVALIPEMAADIKTIKSVQTEQGRDIQRHETYLVAQGMPQRA